MLSKPNTKLIIDVESTITIIISHRVMLKGCRVGIIEEHGLHTLICISYDVHHGNNKLDERQSGGILIRFGHITGLRDNVGCSPRDSESEWLPGIA